MRNIFPSLLALLPLALSGQHIPVNCHHTPLLVYDDAATHLSTSNTVKTDSIAGAVFLNPLPNDSGKGVNGVGYRMQDSLIYGCKNSHLIRIDGTGATEVLAVLPVDSYIGDVTPDGKYYVMELYEILYLVDLESGLYEVTVRNLSFAHDVNYLEIYDMAFDPVSGILYGYDTGEKKLVTIDIETGFVDNNRYPAVGISSNFPAMFFDGYGDLWGLGSQGDEKYFYRFSKETGLITDIIPVTLSISGSTDGCSCPKTFYFQKTAAPDTVSICGGLDFVFNIINRTGHVQQEVEIDDRMPEGVLIDEIIRNPFGGQVGNSVNTNHLSLTGMTIPEGNDSLIVRVKMDHIPPGQYKNQAILKNLKIYGPPPENLLSDDPATRLQTDSTPFVVTDLQTASIHEHLFLCPGETLALDASQPFVQKFTWNTGEDGPKIEVGMEGEYIVALETDCGIASDTFTVSDGSITVDLGEDLAIYAGDSVRVTPVVTGSGAVFSIIWSGDAAQNSMDCFTCLEPLFFPDASTVYTLELVNAYGCPASDELDIRVQNPVYAANVFAPESESPDNLFFIQARQPVQVSFIRVFDRWGELVFERRNFTSDDISSAWDGTFHGRKAPAGIYVWQAELRYSNGKVVALHGDVTIVR